MRRSIRMCGRLAAPPIGVRLGRTVWYRLLARLFPGWRRDRCVCLGCGLADDRFCSLPERSRDLVSPIPSRLLPTFILIWDIARVFTFRLVIRRVLGGRQLPLRWGLRSALPGVVCSDWTAKRQRTISAFRDLLLDRVGRGHVPQNTHLDARATVPAGDSGRCRRSFGALLAVHCCREAFRATLRDPFLTMAGVLMPTRNVFSIRASRKRYPVVFQYPIFFAIASTTDSFSRDGAFYCCWRELFHEIGTVASNAITKTASVFLTLPPRASSF